jgi:hypothetical protein
MVNSLHLAKTAGRIGMMAAFGLALSGCQGISGTPQYAEVRFIAASPDAPGLDVYQNSVAFTYNVGFGTISSYVPNTPGTITTTVDVANTRQQLGAVKASYTLGAQYTVLAANVAANLQMTVLKDQTTPTPSGQVALRFVDETTRTAAVDLYLLPSGSMLTSVSPVVTNLSFGGVTRYIDVPAGTFSIVAVPTGTVPTGTTSPIFTGSQVVYPGGSARTVVLLDQQVLTMPGLQVIVASDYDSPNATN